MGKALKLAVLGGMAGAGVAGYRALKQDETIEVVAKRAAVMGGEVAAAGLVTGFVLDRRTRRKARSAAAVAAARRSKPLAFALAAKPAFDAAMELATHAAEMAKPKVEHAAERAAERAKPVVKHAAEVAKEKAETVAERARPHVVDLTDKVGEKISSLRENGDHRMRPIVVLAESARD